MQIELTLYSLEQLTGQRDALPFFRPYKNMNALAHSTYEGS